MLQVELQVRYPTESSSFVPPSNRHDGSPVEGYFDLCGFDASNNEFCGPNLFSALGLPGAFAC